MKYHLLKHYHSYHFPLFLYMTNYLVFPRFPIFILFIIYFRINFDFVVVYHTELVAYHGNALFGKVNNGAMALTLVVVFLHSCSMLKNSKPNLWGSLSNTAPVSSTSTNRGKF